MKTSQQVTPWWGTFNFDHTHSKIWQIGPLTMIVRCLYDEWLISYERREVFEDSDISITDTDVLPETLAELSRYVFRKTTGILNITPLLADRSVVSRPLTPFNLTAGEEVTLYVGSPLWLELTAGSNRKKLGEICIQRPSDTWFGTSTREGELCYATTSRCRINLHDTPERIHRAITPVTICNNADTTLSVERLILPSPMLSIFKSSDGLLWTSSVKLIREKDGDMAALKVTHKPPAEADNAVVLSKPRIATEKGILIRAFNAVFS